MSDLIILLPTIPKDAWDWGLTGGESWGQARTDEDKQGLSALNFTRLIAVLPGSDVVTKLHTLEGLNEKQLTQAAGFSVEDELAASLSETHIAFDSQSSRLAICSNNRMEQTIHELAKFGLSPDMMCADYDCVVDDWSGEYNGRIISQSGAGLGYSVETGMAQTVLDKDQRIPPPISPEALLTKIAENLVNGHMPINLRQGRFAKRSKIGTARYSRLALLAAGLLIAFFALNAGQGLYYNSKTKALKSEINTIYSEIFPDVEIPANPVLPVIRAQTERQGKTSSDFVSLSALLAKSVQDIDGVEISSLRYDKAKGQLNLSILYGSFEDTEKLKAAVQSNGGVFTEGGTRQNGEGLTGDAVLRGGA